jgi:(p)ppGpp synthase/HD superfamily hydrolase
VSFVQSSIAGETLQVFAPLAKLLGMYSIKSELENLSFMYVSAEDYDRVTSRIANLYKEHEKELTEVISTIIVSELKMPKHRLKNKRILEKNVD